MNNAPVQDSVEAVGVPEEAQCLMAGLLGAARNIQARLEQALEGADLTSAKYQALTALVRGDSPLALSELAGRLNCVKSNVTQLVDRLEADGLVRRVSDPADRRAIRAVVTTLGLERQQAGALAMETMRTWFQARVTEEERQTLDHVLAVLREDGTETRPA